MSESTETTQAEAGQAIKRVSYEPDQTGWPPLEKLPFIKRTKSSRSNWNMPELEDYGDGNRVGALYAVHFAQFLADNPCIVGSNILGIIAEDIDFKDEVTKGCWVGFFATLESMIHATATHVDIWKHLEYMEGKRQEVGKVAGGES